MKNKAPEWLDVILDGKLAQINSKGDVRFVCTHDDPSWCNEKCYKREKNNGNS